MNNIPDELPEVFSEDSFNNMSMLEKALYYSREHHLGVIPINTDMVEKEGKRKPNKRPAISWEKYQTIKPTEAEIFEWFGKGNVNIALIAGKWYGIVCVDIDKRDADSNEEQWIFFQEHELPVTWTSQTWGGWRHYFYKYPEDVDLRNNHELTRNVQFMAQEKILVLPWSKYIDWDIIYEYQWLPACWPWEEDLAEAPQWLIDMNRVGQPHTITTNAPVKKTNWEKFLSETHTEWSRNNALASVSGHIFRAANDWDWEDVAIPRLMKFNQEKLIPPLPSDEAMTTIRSIMSIEKKRREDEAVLRDLNPSRTGDDKKNLMGILYEELVDKIELVTNQNNECYVVDLESPQRRLYEIWSSELTDFILVAYEKKFNRFTNQELAKNLSINMWAQAWKHWKRIITHERIAYIESENALYYDLNNSAWEVVKITEDNIEVTNVHNIYFKRSRTMGEQVRPVSWGGDFDIWDFFNISPENRILFLSYIMSLFMPNINMPILVLRGEKGSAKTTCFRVIKALVDPSTKFQSATISSPKDIDNLQLQLTEWYFHAYDNLSTVKGDMSDILCEAVTGGDFKKRKHHENKEMITLTYSARIGIWSIDNVLWKDDIIDRSLIIDVPKILWGRDFDEEEFRKKLFKHKSQILYYIFCILWKSLGISEEITGLPRMSWFARQWEKIARALWFKDNEFLELYKNHLDCQRQSVKREIIPEFLLISVEHILSTATEWTDTPSKLYEIGKSLNLSMPNEVNSFCRSLYLHAENFEALWIRIVRWKSGNRSITIQRISSENSDSSDSLDDISGEKGGNNSE